MCERKTKFAELQDSQYEEKVLELCDKKGMEYFQFGVFHKYKSNYIDQIMLDALQKLQNKH